MTRNYEERLAVVHRALHDPILKLTDKEACYLIYTWFRSEIAIYRLIRAQKALDKWEDKIKEQMMVFDARHELNDVESYFN